MHTQGIPAHARNDLGDIIRAIRRERELTQEWLALESGLQRKTIHFIERGRVDPRLSSLRRIAQALDMTLVDLFAVSAAREVEKLHRVGS